MITVADAFDALLDVGDVDEDSRGLIEGDHIMEVWWTGLRRMLDSGRELEETEGGFLLVDKDGSISLQSSEYRSHANRRISKYVFDDEETEIVKMKPGRPLKDIANYIRVPLRNLDVTEDTELWSLDEVVELQYGSEFSRSFLIEYPDDSSPGSHIVVESWTSMEPGEDFSASRVRPSEDDTSSPDDSDDRTSDLLVTTYEGGNTRRIVVENINENEETFYITLLRTRGKVLFEDKKTFIEVRDSESIEEYDEVEYKGESTFLTTPDQAHEYGSHVLSLYANPQQKIKLAININYDLSIAYSLELSDRVTVIRRGVTEDYFVESISHRIQPGFRHDLVITVSPTLIYDDVIVLGHGPPLGTGVLGR